MTMTNPLAFCEYLRSVVFVRIGKNRELSNELPANDYAVWLRKYDVWFKDTVITEQRLTYLYNRSVSFLTLDLKAECESINIIASAAKECGFGVLLQAQVEQLIYGRSILENLCYNRALATLFLDGRSLSFIEDKEAVRDLVLWTRNQGISLILFGDFKDWRETGLLGCAELNSGTFSFIPPPKARGPVTQTPSGGELQVLTDSSLSALSEYNPCSSRFQITVTADGWIYPCQGSIGIDALCLGHIDEEPSLLHKRANLSELIHLGPRTPINRGEINTAEGLPEICFAHRRQMLNSVVDA